MTAAHCTNGDQNNPENFQVLLGEHDTGNDNDNMVRADVEQIVQHASYNGATTDYDFALMKLKNKIVWADNPHIRPACLPQDDSTDFSGMTAIVSGWGTTSSGGSLSQQLLFTEVDVISNSECKGYGYSGSDITDQMLCANVQGGGKDACQGDSGGPLVVANPSAYELVGVVSWGVGCALADYPGVYARVSKQLDWVNTNTQGSWNTCPKPVVVG
jgi:secreted trypsin-like serine protease